MIVAPFLIAQFVCAACCIYGFHLIATKPKLGYILSAIGSVGWMVVSDGLFFKAQSLFFFWVAARGYERSK